MITTRNIPTRYQVRFTNGTHESCADAAITKGGGAQGFGPHELLEASLASCINMWISMQADKLGIVVGRIEVAVTLDRTDPELAVFDYRICLDLEGAHSEQDRATLMNAAAECPVKKTLLKQLSFRAVSTDSEEQKI